MSARQLASLHVVDLLRIYTIHTQNVFTREFQMPVEFVCSPVEMDPICHRIKRFIEIQGAQLLLFSLFARFRLWKTGFRFIHFSSLRPKRVCVRRWRKERPECMNGYAHVRRVRLNNRIRMPEWNTFFVASVSFCRVEVPTHAFAHVCTGATHHCISFCDSVGGWTAPFRHNHNKNRLQSSSF